MEANDLQRVKDFYAGLPAKIEDVRNFFGRPVTLAEKILFSHISSFPAEHPKRGEDTLNFLPDRVTMQDATAQMAMLQFISAGLDTVSVPSTIHCDHLIRAQSGSKSDLLRAVDENEEVYNFLKSAAEKYGIGFWQPGSGIIHQVVLEQYAFPGALIIGTDSHTPNGGGAGMLAIGVGGADAVDVMAGLPWGLLNPKLIGVRLTGKLQSWSTPKDVILEVAGRLSVKGGTGKILEYFGPGAEAISCTGKATITNMGAELGATTSVFNFDQEIATYLRATERGEVAELAESVQDCLRSDAEVHENPEQYYDEIVEIDLDKLEPGWVGPHTPDLHRYVSEMPAAIEEESYPEDIKVALIGSCTNSSYEDLARAANIAKQALDAGLKTKIPLMVTPGSDQIFQTIKRDGIMEIFEQVGATVLANACGPCIGQWKREDIDPGETNVIVTSYNRNFKKRNDGNKETLAFISSPELVTAMAFSGKLAFNPLEDELTLDNGDPFKFIPPTGDKLPSAGFVFSKDGFITGDLPLSKRQELQVQIDPASERLAFLEPFTPWQEQDFKDLVLLLKAKGKCTTDHISQAGPWLKYRGHLANIAKNTYTGAVNAFNDQVGQGKNIFTGAEGISFPELALDYQQRGHAWIVVADENYGEGSSREHAAMQPRFLGCCAVITRSFARIAETNLKKQGVLPLTFVNKADYDLIQENDRFCLLGVENLAPDSLLTLQINSADGNTREISLSHSLTSLQVEWFKAGSALNSIKNQ